MSLAVCHARRRLGLIGLALAVLLLPACGEGGSPAPTTAAPQATTAAPEPTTAPTQAAAPGGQTVTIAVVDNQFEPATLSVPAGTTVVWEDQGAHPHTVTADDGSFTSQTLKQGDTFTQTFERAATIAYHCEIHGAAGGVGMSGAIQVSAAAAATGGGPAATTAPAAGAFSLAAAAANRDPGQAARSPALAAGSATAGAAANLWAAWAENAQGGLRQILVSELVDNVFQPRGASLNIHANVVADQPSLAFAGENRAVPWVAWSEPSPGFGNVPQVFASRFNAATGLWQPAGQDRGDHEPSLNLNTAREATHPFIFGGSGDPARLPVPWVVWEELSGGSNFAQIFVAHGVQDDAALGGFHWQAVGAARATGEPSLNVDSRRDGLHPSAAFAEADNAVPWVAWYELGAGRPSRVFAARGLPDASSPGGFKWLDVPACTADEASCALNLDPGHDAEDPSLAAGALVAGEAAVPWIAWAEVGANDKSQVVVARLDVSTENSFVQVGGSLNVDPEHDAVQPSLVFLGHVPYVAFLEDDGNGRLATQLRHLASDAQTGTWALDTPRAGFHVDGAAHQTGVAAAGGDGVFLGWIEGDPDEFETSQLIVGSLRP